MVSNTQQVERIRKRKATTNGKHNKRARRRVGTPAFAIHPEGYDPTAPDAKRAPPAAAPAAASAPSAAAAPAAPKPAKKPALEK